MLHRPLLPALGRLRHHRARWMRNIQRAMFALALPLAACSTPPAPTPLYQQLGGVKGIETVTAALLQRMATDPRTKRTFDGINLRALTESLSNQLCVVANGPCTYEGASMSKAHADLGIKGSEFDVTVQMLREELDRAGVDAAAKNELLRRLAPMRRDMVSSDL